MESSRRELTPFVRSMLQDFFILYSEKKFWTPLREHMDTVGPLTGTFIDVGSGPGLQLVRMVRDYRGDGGIGFDIREDMVTFANEIPSNGALRIRFELGDGLKSPPVEGTGLIMLHRVLHAVEDPCKALCQVKELLPNGGFFLITDWRQADVTEYVNYLYKSSPLSKDEIGELHGRFSKFSPGILREMADMAGLRHRFDFQFNGVMQCALFEASH